GLYKSVQAAEDADKAQRRLVATLQLAGNQAGVTAESIDSLTTALSKTSAFDDTDIKRATAAMLDFAHINKDTLEAAIPVAAYLASKNGDLYGSFRALVASLSDPAENLALLHREYRALSPDVLKAAEDMAKSGDIVGAQGLILAELRKHTSGLAASMATDMD